MLGGQLIRIRLKGYDHKLLDAAVSEIVSTVRHAAAHHQAALPNSGRTVGASF